METIKYSKLYKQDIALGRSQGEVTLGDGRVVSMNEVNLDSFDKLLSEDDSTASGITTVLTLRHTTTGTPASGIGARLALQAESADETPSDLLALEGVFDDVTASSEDSSFYVLLRRGGNALSRALRWIVTGDFLLTFTTTLTADRTWTWPDSTSTVVGTNVTQTLTSKTLTDSLHNAGSGTETFRPDGYINVDLTAASTAANTTETDLITYALPLNTLSANNRGVEIECWGTTATNANGKTMRVYFGNSVIISNNISTAPNGTAWLLRAKVFRTGAATQDAIGTGTVGNIAQAVAFSIPSEDTTGAITIKVTGQAGTATAGEITAEGLSVSYLNG